MQSLTKYPPPASHQRTLDVVGGVLVTLVVGSFVLGWGALLYVAL